MRDTDEAVRALLHAAADPPGGPLIPPTDVLTRAHRRQRRRRSALFSGVAGVTALIIAIPVVVASTRDERALPSHPSPSPSPSVESSVESSLGTAAALANDQWSKLPSPPIPPRSGAAAVWTGTEMLIWGGGQQGKAPENLRSDGAAYNPATHRWAKTAVSPLTPRYEPAYAWTGSKLFVWGGLEAGPLHTSAFIPDGALYDPAQRRWTKIPAAPLPALGSAQAVWVNGTVLVIGQSPGDRPITAYAAEFDPKTDTWLRLPDLPVVRGNQRLQVKVASSGTDAYVISYNSSQVSGKNAGFTFNVDSFELPAGSHTWQPLVGSPALFSDAPPLMVEGRIVVAAGNPTFPIPSPPGFVAAGRTLLPSASSWSQLPTGPIDHGYPEWASTGTALIGLVTAQANGYPGLATPLQGSAAAWDPTSRRWTTLPSAPIGYLKDLAISAEVWTGRELLIWGGAVDPRADSPLAIASPVGLRFGP